MQMHFSQVLFRICSYWDKAVAGTPRKFASAEIGATWLPACRDVHGLGHMQQSPVHWQQDADNT